MTWYSEEIPIYKSPCEECHNIYYHKPSCSNFKPEWLEELLNGMFNDKDFFTEEEP